MKKMENLNNSLVNPPEKPQQNTNLPPAQNTQHDANLHTSESYESVPQSTPSSATSSIAEVQLPSTAQNTNTSPSLSGQPASVLSASQMGLNGPSNKQGLNIKKLIIGLLIGLAAICIVLVVLIATNVITLSEFKMVTYTDLKDTKYQLTFYSKHTTTELKSGNQQLVSKVSEDGKYPITLSIATSDASGYDKYKNCGSFTKVFEVQNSNLNQNIAVCDVLASTEAKAGVYIAVFSENNQTHILTISQDLSGVDTSSPSAAKNSLQKFGLQPYDNDIKTIIASIKVEQ